MRGLSGISSIGLWRKPFFVFPAVIEPAVPNTWKPLGAYKSQSIPTHFVLNAPLPSIRDFSPATDTPKSAYFDGIVPVQPTY